MISTDRAPHRPAADAGELPEITVKGPVSGRMNEILSDEALAFVAMLARTFGGRVQSLLERRRAESDPLKARAQQREETIRIAHWLADPHSDDVRRAPLEGEPHREA